MFMQLNPPIPLVTPKGKAWAIGMIDYGPQWDLQWITFIHGTGECWTFDNKQIRQEDNYTFGIPKPTPIQQPTQRPSLNVHAMEQEIPAAISVNGIHMNGNSPVKN